MWVADCSFLVDYSFQNLTEDSISGLFIFKVFPEGNTRLKILKQNKTKTEKEHAGAGEMTVP